MLENMSKRVYQIKPSATMAVNAKAMELSCAGHKIINLSVGEPDFDTPDFIKAAAIEAIQQGFTKYTAADGIPELKEAIIHKLKKDNRLDYLPNQIMVSTGLKQVFFNLAQALLNEGDEVIIPAPYWVSYPAIVTLAGAKPIIIPSTIDHRFKLTAKQLEEAITPKTRLLILNSPNNPTGMAYTAEELNSLATVLKKHPRIIIASDDIYEYILWGMNCYINILNVCPELKDRTVIGNGLSKAYAMTGWRIGYAAAPESIINGMKKIQSQSTTCANSIAQKASVTALNANNDFFKPMLEAYKRRHDNVYEALNKIDGIECLKSDGTFYLFPNMQAIIERLGLKNDIALAEFFLEKAGVAMVPGTAFGAPGYIRLSCATHETNLENAIRQIHNVLN